MQEINKIISEEDLDAYLERFDKAYKKVLDTTLTKISEQVSAGRLSADFANKVMVSAIGNSQEIALKMLNVDIAQIGAIEQVKQMNQSVFDNRLIRTGDFIGNTIGYVGQGGKPIPKQLYELLFISAKALMNNAGMEEDVNSIDWNIGEMVG